jgi:hypothetical protein
MTFLHYIAVALLESVRQWLDILCHNSKHQCVREQAHLHNDALIW